MALKFNTRKTISENVRNAGKLVAAPTATLSNIEAQAMIKTLNQQLAASRKPADYTCSYNGVFNPDSL